MTSTIVLIGILLAAPQPIALRAPDPITDVISADINGDGKADILAVCADTDTIPVTKRLILFMGGDSPAFEQERSHTIPLETRVSALMLAREHDQSLPTLILAHMGGATLHRFSQDHIAPAGQRTFLSLLPSDGAPPHFLQQFVVDLDGDGSDEWLIPGPDNFLLFDHEGPPVSIPYSVSSTLVEGDRLLISHRIPLITTVTGSGTETKGLAFTHDHHIDYAYGEAWQTMHRHELPNKRMKDAETHTSLQDINADGLPDLTIIELRGNVQLNVKTSIYLATEPNTLPETPNHVFEFSGGFSSPLFEDIDGDKDLDIVFVRVPLNAKTILSYFLRNRISLSLEAYPFADGAYAQAPQAKASVSVTIPEARERVAYTMADFNGDGLMDLALSDGPDAIVVHYGSAEHFISKRPDERILIPALGTLRTYRLDDNERDDMVLIHPDGEHDRRLEVVIF